MNHPRPTVLRFTPYAWAKLKWFCHRGDTEIGGFGVAAPGDAPGDLLLVTDFITVPQRTTAVSVSFDDTAVGDIFESLVDAGLKPHQFARLWCHTHPGDSTTPSSTDEETFQRVFGHCDWAVMFILARSGKTYARLRFNVGPGGQVIIPVEVDYTQPFDGSDCQEWQAEYDAHVYPDPSWPGRAPGAHGWESEHFGAWSERRERELGHPRRESELMDELSSYQDVVDALDESLWDPRSPR